MQLNGMPPACQRLAALAERDPRRAVPLARRALERPEADDPLTEAWASYTLGWALLCWERPDQARPYLQAAQAALAAHGLRVGALSCRYAVLLADQIQLARAGLEQDFAALAEEFARAAAPIEAARIELQRARQFNMLGRPRDAAAILDRIAAILLDATPLDAGRLLRVRAVTANLRNDFDGAIELLAQAERVFSILGYRYEVAKCWFERAWVALRQEQLDVALAGYQRAEHVFTRFDLPLQLAFCTKNISLLMSRRGAYDSALRTTLTAMTNFGALKRMSDMGACHLHVGNIYFYTSRWEAALAAYTRAETIYEALGVDGYWLVAKRNRAMVYRAQHRHAEAQALLAIVEAQARDLDNQAELAEAWRQQAELHADQGAIEEAMRQYHAAHALFMQIGNRLGVADCAMELGWLAITQGALETARSFFQSAAPLVALHPYNLWRIEYGLARCAELDRAVEQALSHYRIASIIVADLRGRLASEEISSSLYAQAVQLHDNALRLAYANGAAETVLAISEGQRALVFQRKLAIGMVGDIPPEYLAELGRIDRELGVLMAQGARDAEAYGQALDTALAAYGELLLHAAHSLPAAHPDSLPIDAFDLAQARATLNQAFGSDWTALTYTFSHGFLLICVVTPEGLTIEQLPYEREFQRLIARATQPEYRRHTYHDLPYLQGQTKQRWKTLHDLADRLLPARARTRLSANHHLLIVPAGPLHALPWGALRLDQCWLAERAIVQLAPGLAAWQVLAARVPADAALLVGCGDFGGRMPSLPNVDAELTAIAERWPSQVAQLRGDQASRQGLLERSRHGELARCGLLHFATHARMLPARGLAAHVALSDSNLLLEEITRLRISGALVVLSACDGAAVDALPGEEILSLSWALLAAGASGVLASLWKVDDEAVPRFMIAFYDALRQCRDVGVALALAQRSQIGAGISDVSAPGPECWGSFVLTGQSRWSE